MDKLQAIRGVAFDLDGTLVDSAPGLTSAVDQALYALELPVAGEERVVTWIGNGADVLMARALTWARQERASQRSAPVNRALITRISRRKSSCVFCANCSIVSMKRPSRRAASCSRTFRKR